MYKKKPARKRLPRDVLFNYLEAFGVDARDVFIERNFERKWMFSVSKKGVPVQEDIGALNQYELVEEKCRTGKL